MPNQQARAGSGSFCAGGCEYDGKLTLNEASDYFVVQIFAGRDANHDGQLTLGEWHVPGGSESKAKFKAADTNHDGALSLEESARLRRQSGLYKQEFREADTNHDGYVTREEAQAYSASKERFTAGTRPRVKLLTGRSPLDGCLLTERAEAAKWLGRTR